MKKTYISPAVKVVRIEKRLLTSASLGVYKDNVNDTGDLLGRNFDFDDEDEE